MHQVEIEEARDQLADLIEEAIAGESVVITRHGEPVVRLVTAETPRRSRRTFGSARGLIAIGEGFDEPLEDFRAYM